MTRSTFYDIINLPNLAHSDLIKASDRSLRRSLANHSGSLYVQTMLHQRKSLKPHLSAFYVISSLVIIKDLNDIIFNSQVRRCNEVCQRRVHCGRRKRIRGARISSIVLAPTSGGRTHRAGLPSDVQLLQVGGEGGGGGGGKWGEPGGCSGFLRQLCKC